jgi:hypothetical protein
MRSQRDKRNTQKTSVSSLEAVETTWQSEVSRLTEKEPSTLLVHEIKALLTVLAMYLATAPSYESQECLMLYMSSLREQLDRLMTGPDSIVRPP